MLVVYAFHFVSISFWSVSYLNRTTLHFAYIANIHLSTARLREILISISQAHSFRFPQALFPTHFQWYIFIFCDKLAPKTNILNFPNHPLVVAVISGNRVLLPVLAVGAFILAPLCSGNYVRSSLRTPTLHFTFIYASTSAPHGISSSILSLHMFRSFSPYTCQFSTHFQRLPSFLRRVCPNEENPFGFDKDWFLFPKGFKKTNIKKTNTTRTF